MPIASINSVKIAGEVNVDSIHIQPSHETSKLMPKITLLPPYPVKPNDKVHLNSYKEPAVEINEFLYRYKNNNFMVRLQMP